MGSALRKPIKIAIAGAFGQNNLGNECTLEGFLWHCRKYLPDAEITCMCTVPEDTSARHDIPAFPLSARYSNVWPGARNLMLKAVRKVFIHLPLEIIHWVKAFMALAGHDVLFVPGTGFLTDAYQSSFGWPYAIFKWSLLAKLRGCKLLYVSVGAGPIQRPLSRWFIKSALLLADFRSYRDGATKEYLRRIGFPAGNDRVSPDLAFNLPEAVLPRRDTRRTPRPVVGVGVMSYAGKPTLRASGNALDCEYLDKLARFVKWLLAHEYDVRLLLGDLRYDGPAMEYFRTCLSQNVSKRHRGRVIEEPVSSVQHLLSQLTATDAVVATRFHNVVLALLLNKPVISISFHHKCVSLMDEMGLSAYCQDIDRLNVDRLIDQFCDLERNAQTLKGLIQRKTEACRKALDEQYRVIFNDVCSMKYRSGIGATLRVLLRARHV